MTSRSRNSSFNGDTSDFDLVDETNVEDKPITTEDATKLPTEATEQKEKAIDVSSCSDETADKIAEVLASIFTCLLILYFCFYVYDLRARNAQLMHEEAELDGRLLNVTSERDELEAHLNITQSKYRNLLAKISKQKDEEETLKTYQEIIWEWFTEFESELNDHRVQSTQQFQRFREHVIEQCMIHSTSNDLVKAQYGYLRNRRFNLWRDNWHVKTPVIGFCDEGKNMCALAAKLLSEVRD